MMVRVKGIQFLMVLCLSTVMAPIMAQVNFTSSNLPIVIINTHGQTIVDEPKIVADMGIIDNGPGVRNAVTDPFNNYSGKIGIEIRGSSSQSFPKKQYGIELMDAVGAELEAPLLGMPKEEDWVLFAPYNDKSLMRDVLAYKMGRLQNRYAPRTRYCEVVINGEYMGVYVLIEKIKRDKNRVDLNKLDPNEVTGDNLTGGYILKVDKDTGNPGQGWNSSFPPPNRSGNQKITFWYEVPKAEDIMGEQKQYIQQYVTNFEATLNGSNFKDPVNGYAKYMDAASFIDYFIINEASKNVDGYRISTFLHKKRDSDGGKIHMGPVWDYNLGFGNADYCTSGTTYGFVLDFNSTCPGDGWLIPFWWDRLLEDQAYRNQLGTRWTTLRQGPFQTTNIHTFIDSVAIVLNAEAQQRNFQRWPVLGQYVWPNYFVGTTFQNEVDWLKQWVSNRMAWLDIHIGSMVTSVEAESNFISLAAYPNPFTQDVHLDYETRTPGEVSVTVLDLLGNIKYVTRQDRPTPGYFEQMLPLQDQPAGVYMVKVQLKNSPKLIRRVVKN